MQRITATALTALAMLTLSLPASSKGRVVAIEIAGDGLAGALELTDPALLAAFDIWNGPGVDEPPPDARMDPALRAGAFVDWNGGIVTERPAGMRRYEVVFRIDFNDAHGGRAGQYYIGYELDAASGHGYIYLPRWKNDLVVHGLEGHWLHASASWDEHIGQIVAQHAGAQARPASDGVFACTVGTGVVEEDGAVAIHLLQEDGSRSSTFRYRPGDADYTDVKAHVGPRAADHEIPVSCWPPRR